MWSVRTRIGAAVLALAMAAPGAIADVPKAADGHPDLTGNWNIGSLTPLQRAKNISSLVVSEADAKAIAAGVPMGGVTEDGFKGATYSDPTKGAPPKGGSDFGVQAYDSFWMDPGARLAFVKGEWRTSAIVEPANGQLPYKDPEKQIRKRALTAERYAKGNANYDGPEVPTLAERCIVFASRGGPGMTSALYNNNYQVVQTATHMVIVVEQVHDARIVPIFTSAEQARAGHRPAAIQPWLGDSVGWWDGDTFVMETVNINPLQADQHSFPISGKAVITERFTRTSETDVVYEFSVDDPETYTQPWKAELGLYPIERLFEYACHEGNYGMHGILAGARKADREAMETAKAKARPAKGAKDRSR